MYKKRGFTLIELLVTISIIGVLSSIVVSSLGSARAQARDAKRVAEIQQVGKALEMYYNAAGSYPQPSLPEEPVPLSYLRVNLVSYIPVIPEDPLGDAFHQYYYTWGDGGRSYAILVRLESGGGNYSVSGQNILSDWKDPSWWGSY